MEYLFQKLTENIKNHSNIVLMTHKHPDLDGMGSAIALSKIIKSLKKESYILFPKDQVNMSLEKGIQALKEKNIEINFKNYEEILKLIDENTLLIVLDTQVPSIVENSELLTLIKDIFVIDHHTTTANHIKNTIFEYINSSKSSVVEIITEYIKYLNKTLDPVIITLLSAGMEIDTRSYSLKTSENTFKMAGYLTKLGTDPILKKEILKENKADATKRHNYIKKSYYIKEGYLLCDMGDKEKNDPVELALLADELLSFDGVEASFAVGKLNDGQTGVSARSMGQINVAEIMNKIGGGGHITDAAAQFKNLKTKEIIKLIKKALEEE